MKVVEFSPNWFHKLPLCLTRCWVWPDIFQLNWYSLSLQMIMSDFDWMFILYQILSSKQLYELVYFILVNCRIPILQIKKLSFNFAQGHTAIKWWNSNQGLCDPRAPLLIPHHTFTMETIHQKTRIQPDSGKILASPQPILSVNSAGGHRMYQSRGHAEMSSWTWRDPLEGIDPWGIKKTISLLCVVYLCVGI